MEKKNRNTASAHCLPELLRSLALPCVLLAASLALWGNTWASDLSDWRAPVRKARLKNPVPKTPENIEAGRALFLTACAPCHGQSGREDGPAAASLERKPGNLTDSARMWAQTDGELFWKISTGRSPMPAFETAYDETQRWQIVIYVRTLAPKPKTLANK